MSNVVLFDLEDTLIYHWTNRELSHTERIHQLLNDDDLVNDSDVYGIFSYALWSLENLLEFKNSEFKINVENEYLIKFNDNYIFTVDDMCKFSEKQHHQSKPLNVSTYWKYYPKHHAIIDLALSGNFDEFDTIVLFDDTAPHGMMVELEKHPNVVLFNPKS